MELLFGSREVLSCRVLNEDIIPFRKFLLIKIVYSKIALILLTPDEEASSVRENKSIVSDTAEIENFKD